MLAQEHVERLVSLISSGRNTYADIRQVFPQMEDDELITHITGPSGTCTISPAGKSPQLLLILTSAPAKLTGNYQFKPDDQFSLTIQGQDVLYQLQKEERIAYLAESRYRSSRFNDWCILILTSITTIATLYSIWPH